MVLFSEAAVPSFPLDVFVQFIQVYVRNPNTALHRKGSENEEGLFESTKIKVSKMILGITQLLCRTAISALIVAELMRYLYLVNSSNWETSTIPQMSGNITPGFHTYGSQAAGTGGAKNQLSALGKLTAGMTVNSKANWILPTTTRPGLIAGTLIQPSWPPLHYLLSNGTYSRSKLFLQLCLSTSSPPFPVGNIISRCFFFFDWCNFSLIALWCADRGENCQWFPLVRQNVASECADVRAESRKCVWSICYFFQRAKL